MQRRSVLQSIGALSTHVLFPGILASFVLSCQQEPTLRRDYTPLFFEDDLFSALQQMIDLIIPQTQSPSASQAGVHYFLDEVFAKCLTETEQNEMSTGLQTLITKLQNTPTPEALLTEVDQQAFAGVSDYNFFRRLKQFTLVGFFTSQAGMTQASNYVKIPGDYRGEIEANEETLNYGKTDMRYYL